LSRLRPAFPVFVPLALAALELAHPTFPGAAPSQAVAAVGAWWLALHLALIVGYALLVSSLWSRSRLARLALAVFVLCNTAFLAVDGLGVGLLASTDPGGADAFWNSPPVIALGDATGAAWAAALLLIAAQSTRPSRLITLALSVAWLNLVASTVVPQARLVSFALATAIAAYRLYQAGATGLPFALLVFAALLRQHVGPEAAVGMLCIALARVDRLRARSSPEASSPPSPG